MAKLKGKAKAKFLARMARGRNKHKRKTHHKRKTTTHHKEHHVAKRRHHKKGKTRRRHHTAMGGMGKWIPDQQRLVAIGSAFAYGKVEAAASKDSTHFINKIPAPIAQIGRAGNLGALLWLGGVITRHPVVKSVATGVITVAAYQNGRGAGFTKDSPDFKMSGPGGRGHGQHEMMVDRYLKQRGGE